MDARRLIPMGWLIVLWSWESWRPLFGQPQGRLRHALGNLTLALANTLLVVLVFGVPTVWLMALTEEQNLGLLNRLAVEGPWRWLIGLVLLDGWMYLWHRANHGVPLLWHFHRLHHLDRHMDVTTATRFHPGELIGAALVRLALIPLVGLDAWLLAGYETLLLIVTQLHHADVSLGRLDWWLRLVIVTPDLHKVHHSQEPAEHHSNFSTVFSVWDRLAGTWQTRPDVGAIRFGLPEDRVDRSHRNILVQAAPVRKRVCRTVS